MTNTTQKDPMVAAVEEIELEKVQAEENKKKAELDAKEKEARRAVAFAKTVATMMFAKDTLEEVPGITGVNASGPDKCSFKMHGQSVFVYIEAQMDRSSYRSRPTGKQVLVVEIGFGSDNRRRYPENNKGGFNWTKASVHVIETAQAVKAQEKHRNDQERKRKMAEAAAEKMNLAKGCAVAEKVSWKDTPYISTKRAYIKVNEYGAFTIQMPTNLTIDQAEKILDLLIAMELHK